MDQDKLFDLVERSGKTDLPILLQAKEEMKRAVAGDPSEKNVASFERLSRLVETRMAATTNLKNAGAVLAYIKENGKKVAKTKLYDDIGKARLKKQTDGSFAVKDVDRYMASLPGMGTSEKEAEDAADRQKRKEEGEIRRVNAQAEKEELSVKKLKGQLVDRQEVYELLAARAITLDSDIKGAIAAQANELVSQVEGDPRKTKNLISALDAILDEALGEYAKTEEIEVMFQESVPEGNDHADGEEATCS